MKKQNDMIVPLQYADRGDIGNKARNLSRLLNQKPSLFTVPAGIVLLPGFALEDHLADAIHALKAIGDGWLLN